MRAGGARCPLLALLAHGHHAGRGKHGVGSCAGAAEALPPACPAEVEAKASPLPALHPNVPKVAACGGCGLFGAVRWRRAGWRWNRSGQAGGWAGVRTRSPPHAFPSLPSPPSCYAFTHDSWRFLSPFQLI